MVTYFYRKKCVLEDGFHYFYGTQVDVIDESILCPDHPENNVEDYVIEKEELDNG